MLNGFFVVVFALVGAFYVYPAYEAIGENENALNSEYEKIERIKSNGLTAEEYLALTSKKPKNAVSAEDKAKITEVLKKPANTTQSYKEWLIEEQGKTKEMNAVAESNARVIGNIIPTFNQGVELDGEFKKNNITLATFVKYVEERLLKRFNLESHSPVGFGTLDFGSGSLTSIASFKLPLDVEGTNSSIISMLDSIQKSGKFLIKDGRLVESGVPASQSGSSSLSSLSNLLVTISSASFETPLDSTSSSKNKASLELTFYVKGISYSDYLDIRTKLAKGISDLKARIEKGGAFCPKSASCTDERVNSASIKIREMFDDITVLNGKISELAKSANVKNLSTDYATLANISSTYQILLFQVTQNEKFLK